MLVGQTVSEHSDDDFSWPLAVMIMGFFLAVASIVGIAVWQGLATWRARMSIAREEAYRTLVETTEATNNRTADLLASMKNDLADLRTRTAELERLLKEVG